MNKAPHHSHSGLYIFFYKTLVPVMLDELNLLLPALFCNTIQSNIPFSFNNLSFFCHLNTPSWDRMKFHLVFLFKWTLVTMSNERMKSSSKCVSNLPQDPEETPSFQFYPSFRWELRQRAFRLFQQAARKVYTSMYCLVTEVMHTCMSIYWDAQHIHTFLSPSGEGCSRVPLVQPCINSSH